MVCTVVVCTVVVCAAAVDTLLAATVEVVPTDVERTATRLLVDVLALALSLVPMAPMPPPMPPLLLLGLTLVLGVVALETAAVEKSAGRVTECERAQDSGEAPYSRKM